MRAFFVGLAVILAALLVAVLLVDTQDAHPPHAARPTAAAIGTPWPLSVTGGASAEGVRMEVEAWIEGVEREQERQAAALADLARSNPVRSGGGSVGGGDCAALAQQLGLPEAVLWRESRCSWDAYNATGCSGRGCVGPAQVDLGHFAPVSPWNPRAVGVCYGLDVNDPADYAECVSRLPASAWG